MPDIAAELARRLAHNAEAVCRQYLSNGRREGNYWLVGDATNSAGRSLFVRLRGPESGKGAAGKWTDAATAEHGDLLDIVRLSRNLATVSEAMDEARLFLGLPRPEPPKPIPAPRSSPEASRRLYAMGQPLRGTLAHDYLLGRGITADVRSLPLRFHPNCYHQSGEHGPREARPALLAAITDLAGTIDLPPSEWSIDYDSLDHERDEELICPRLSGPSTMIVWITKGTRNAEQEAQAGRDHRQAA